jgi:hypothetical protein
MAFEDPDECMCFGKAFGCGYGNGTGSGYKDRGCGEPYGGDLSSGGTAGFGQGLARNSGSGDGDGKGHANGTSINYDWAYTERFKKSIRRN